MDHESQPGVELSGVPRASKVPRSAVVKAVPVKRGSNRAYMGEGSLMPVMPESASDSPP